MKISTIWRIINSWDPMDKIDGIHIDEYRHEINRIAITYNDVENSEKLAKGIHDVFTNRYGQEKFKYSIEECLEIAEKLMKE